MKKSFKTVDKNGIERWKLPHGQLHREDGPALIQPGVFKAWFLDGKNYSETEFNEKINRIKGLEETLKGITT